MTTVPKTASGKYFLLKARMPPVNPNAKSYESNYSNGILQLKMIIMIPISFY